MTHEKSTGPRTSSIIIRGARVHNLKNISLDLPRNKLIVITGVSGSGKSSLAFDTIYAEGQRRYVESLSAYARQFLERMDKPDVDVIQGISPAMAIEQKTNSRNPRSTVGTTTEIYDYLRLLFGRIGQTFCPKCGATIRRDTVASVVEYLQKLPDGTKVYVMFPVHDHPKVTVNQEIENLQKQGYFRFVLDGTIIDVNESDFHRSAQVDRHKRTGQASGFPAKVRKQDLRVLIDRLVVRHATADSRITDSIETAFTSGDGYAIIREVESGLETLFNQHFACSNCGIQFEEPQPRLFSFNNPFGACPQCQGFGRAVGIDMELVAPNRSRTIREGAIVPWTTPKFKEHLRALLRVHQRANVRVDVPYEALTAEEIRVIMEGYEDFYGLNKFFKEIERKTYKIHYRVFLSRFRGYTTCPACDGARLRPEALNIKVGSKNIAEIVRMTIWEVEEFFRLLELSDHEWDIARRIMEELRRRLKYLVEVGIGYLTLDRLSSTLSGGESQRINLATSLGSSLVGSLYVLDEPSIGLHPRDIHRLITILESLREVGNTVLVVEHDAEMMRESDVIVDLGPRAGEEGGEVIFLGSYDQILKHAESLTGKYLSGRLSIPLPAKRRTGKAKTLRILGAAEHNLKNITVDIPLNRFVCVTGVSGSGKSTLVHQILYAGLRRQKGEYDESVGKVRGFEGGDLVDAVEMVDQSPIGRTPRSNPVTYIKVFDLIRDLLANTQQARIRGYKPGYFSFNVPGGRCDVCEGDGYQKIEMQFMADLYLLCESCKGRRFKSEVLDVKYHGKNVDDILAMTVTEAIEFFRHDPTGRRVASRLQVLADVGLGYLRLGQPATTLSGGEAQRVKLALHLAAKETEGHILFIFDEPTTGLHFDDIAKLLKCFNALIDAGHSVLIIEHNIDVIKCADHVIDLGPEGGAAGGYIVTVGTPEEIAKHPSSYTGKFLKAALQ
ncbi:MAG: excinuclease ABC subunit UvrA [Bacteroidota bacterium]